MADSIIKQISTCINSKTNFLLSGGAGCGKTYTLIQTLNHIFQNFPKSQVACITYTNVAVNEIKERSPYKKLVVSTIHDFLWEEIKEYQKNLKKSIVQLITYENENKGTGLTYNGENEITEETLDVIEYRNYRSLEKGVISHDDLLKIANYMFATYPLLAKITSDKFDYILIDEYQDTQSLVVEIFLTHINKVKTNLCLGFFGDKLQSIYPTGVGDIQSFVDNGIVTEIKKEDNYRCSVNVINLLNNIRSDITQKPSNLNDDGSIANKQGSACFVYSKHDFVFDDFKMNPLVSDWDFEDGEKTKMLFLTHKLIANRIGFIDLLSAYKYTDNLIGNEPDKLALHLLKIGGILYNFTNNNYSYVIEKIHRKLRTNQDKKEISAFLNEIVTSFDGTIEDLINQFDKEKIVIKDDSFRDYITNYADVFDKIKVLPKAQVTSYFEYYNSYTPYSTQHGIKGAEFDNVLVVMDNGKWNSYNFKAYFENDGKDSVIERTKRIFYVSCSRAKDNLVVYYPSPTDDIVCQAVQLFGKDNVISI